MQYALPIAGAALGAVTFGTSFAISVGWMVGSWIASAMMKQKNDVFDPGAEEMPLFNQALRGATMPVTFGTNRVQSQIVWTYNFTTTRLDSGGGGGKMGGSGGGKAPAGGGSVSYQYKWDMVYHLGMVQSTRTYRLFGGWDGPDRMNDSTILAIDPADQGSQISASDLSVGEEENGISFDEAFFYNGDPTIEGWAHLQSAIGQDIRWPYTAWIGFKQLDLGASTHVPQLTWEIGPGARSLTGEPGTLQYSGETIAAERMSHSPNVDIHGQKYLVVGASLGDLNVYVYGNDAQFIGSDNYQSDIETQIGSSLGATHGMWANLDATGQYLIGFIQDVSPTKTYIFVCSVNDGAIPTFLGCVWMDAAPFDVNRETEIRVSGKGRVELDGIIIRQASSSGGVTGWYVFPSISSIANSVYINGWGDIHEGSASWGAYEIPAIFIRANSSDFYEDWYNYTNLPGSSWVTYSGGDTIVNFYFSKVDMDWYAANPGSSLTNPYTRDTLQPAHPNGCSVAVNIGSCLYGDIGPSGADKSTTITFDHAANVSVIDFDDSESSSYNSFSDEDENIDGGSGGNSYSRQVYSEWLDIDSLQGLVVFFKGFNDSTSQQPGVGANGYLYGSLRAYLFNAFLQTYTEIAVKQGMLLFRSNDIGVTLTSTMNLNKGVSFWRNDDTLTLVFNYWDSPTPNGTQNNVIYLTGFTVNVTGGDDITPPEIIYDILTNSVYGRGYPTSLIDDTTYQAAKTYCEDNEIKVSTTWRREQNFMEVIELCLEVYGGYITKSNGIIYFGLIDTGADPVSVRTLDNEHFVIDQRGEPPLTVTDAAHQDTFNKIRVNYLDRNLEYKQNQVEVGDEVDQDLYGIRMREFPPQFVMKEKIAEQMATRALWSNLYPRKVFSFKLGWKDHDIEPGDVVTLVDSFSSINRLARITYKREMRRGVWEAKAIEEFLGLYTIVGSNTSVSSPSNSVVAKPIAPSSFFTMYELPYEFQETDNGALYAGYVPSVFAAGGRVYISADGVSYTLAQEATPYPLGGTLLTNLPHRDTGRFEDRVRVALFPSSGWTVNSPTYSIEATLNEVGEAGRAIGAGLLWVGSEMLAYEGVTLLGQNYYEFDRVYRGWGSTAISAHNSGEYFIKHGSGIFMQNFTEDKIGNIIYYKISPINLSGIEYSVSSITAQTYQIRGAHYGAQNAGLLRFANSGDVGGKKKVYVGSSVDIRIDWTDAGRKSGFGVGGFGLGGFGDFSTDPISHNWYVQVVGSGNTVVYSSTVTTPSFTYPGTQNTADNGVWRGNVAIKVRPFANAGTVLAPRTSVISLELFS